MEPDRVTKISGGSRGPDARKDPEGGEDEREYQPSRPERGGNPDILQIPAQPPWDAHLPIFRTGLRGNCTFV